MVLECHIPTFHMHHFLYFFVIFVIFVFFPCAIQRSNRFLPITNCFSFRILFTFIPHMNSLPSSVTAAAWLCPAANEDTCYIFFRMINILKIKSNVFVILNLVQWIKVIISFLLQFFGTRKSKETKTTPSNNMHFGNIKYIYIYIFLYKQILMTKPEHIFVLFF